MTIIIRDSGSMLSLILFLLYRLGSTSGNNIYLVRPGDGEEFVYSPVGVNTTLQCAVNNTILTWVVDTMLNFDSPVQRLVLNSRGIFQSRSTTSVDGITASSVTVIGNRELNNNTRICCQVFANELKENCTTLVIYGKVIIILFKIQLCNNNITIR